MPPYIRRPIRRRQPLRGRAAAAYKAQLEKETISLGCLESIESDSEGEACELHAYEKRVDTRGDEVLLRVGVKTHHDGLSDKSHRAALVQYKHYTRARQLKKTELQIRSPHIRKALQTVVKSYPGVKIDSTGRIVLEEEPKVLFHFQDELEQYAAESRSGDVQSHIRFGLEYMRKVLRMEIGAYQVTVGQAVADPGLEHRNLWMAYKPGTILYQRYHGIDALFKLQSMQLNQFTVEGTTYENLQDMWILKTSRIHYNGSQIGYVEHSARISSYSGCRPFSQLNIFPLEYHPDKDRIRDEILERGNKYLSLLGIHHRSYDGVAKLCYSRSSSYAFTLTFNLTIRNRIMIDCDQFHCDAKSSPHFMPGGQVLQVESGIRPRLTDEDTLLCPPFVQGYSLTNKLWGHFEVSKIGDIDFSDDAFDKLVLPEEKKRLISLLVQQQDDQADGFHDFIKGKGKGLIFLLHGPPGVGKTFTAESIADRTKRPLLPINSGQIIGPAPWVEHRLETILSLATRWKALVLLDEADVFMQERTTEELERNGLVSSLLRIIEYFDGIMFLTTNRFGAMDSAFKSRIHLSISYPPLAVGGKKQLWETSLTRASGGKLPRWANKRFLEKVSTSQLNGREIKNIVGMAHAFSRNNHRPMKAEDVFLGIQALEAFDADLDPAQAHQRPNTSALIPHPQHLGRPQPQTQRRPSWRNWNLLWFLRST